MEYLSPEHRIMRYLAKPKAWNFIAVAHLKGMKEDGKDYTDLQEIEASNLGLSWDSPVFISEKKEYEDAKFDRAKVKQVFLDKELMTDREFEDACSLLEAEGYISNFEATEKAIDEFEAMEVSQRDKIGKEGII